MNVSFGPDVAGRLAEKAAYVQMAGRELSLFGETEPWLAAQCGVEIGALEARTILAGGSALRVGRLAEEAARSRAPVILASEDLEALSRLEGVLAVSSSRIGQAVALIDSREKSSGMENLGSVIGLATGAIGLYKSIF
jgi:hypothetical protein